MGKVAACKQPIMNKSGLILIVLGCLFLAHNFGLLEWGWLRQWWPLILIGSGWQSVLDQAFTQMDIYIPAKQREFVTFAKDIHTAVHLLEG